MLLVTAAGYTVCGRGGCCCLQLLVAKFVGAVGVVGYTVCGSCWLHGLWEVWVFLVTRFVGAVGVVVYSCWSHDFWSGGCCLLHGLWKRWVLLVTAAGYTVYGRGGCCWLHGLCLPSPTAGTGNRARDLSILNPLRIFSDR